jgi:hypothetical protein
MNRIPIKYGADLAELFWPEFVSSRGCVFLKREKPARKWDASHPVTMESDASHTQILDGFEHRAGLKRAPFYNRRHPDFKQAYEIGRIVCQLWARKLQQDFPRDNFRVYLHGFDPIVRFHKIRDGLANWAEPKQWRTEIKAGNAMILDTSKM